MRGARPMRDAVEKLVGDAVSECLLDARPACGILALDETRDCLVVRLLSSDRPEQITSPEKDFPKLNSYSFPR